MEGVLNIGTFERQNPSGAERFRDGFANAFPQPVEIRLRWRRCGIPEWKNSGSIAEDRDSGERQNTCGTPPIHFISVTDVSRSHPANLPRSHRRKDLVNLLQKEEP